MSLLALLLFFLGCSVCVEAQRKLGAKDYCWRDHDGIAPSDAFKAGIDRSGDPIYIGQALYENKLIPGKIHEGSSEIHIEFTTVHVLNETVKILCTDYPEKFEWFKTRYDEILNITNKHIFEGGYEKGFITYVGRALSHGEMTVGKVMCFKDGCYKLTTIEEGKWSDHTEFEILTYNPDVKVSSTTTTTTYKPNVPAVPTSSNAGAGGYYWRDYEGEIPEDAFKAGKDGEGNTIYIGQVVHEADTIPGQISQSKKKVYYDYQHSERSTDMNAKILCIGHPEQYKWIKTDDAKFDGLDESLLVVGGFRPNYKTYIGRVTSEEVTSVGKVLVGNGMKELHITKYGVAVDFKIFEVLSFDSTAPTITTSSYLLTTSKTLNGEPFVSESDWEEGCVQHIINITIY